VHVRRPLVATPLVIAVAAIGALAASCGSSQAARNSKLTVRATEVLRSQDVTDGSVAGAGRFVIAGPITDRGTVTDYRTVRGTKALIRRVAVGKKGTITFLITINLATGSEPWSITSGTGTYRDLHGNGTETVDNYQSNPATFTLSGTVSQ
jgi:hypothetical protein